MITPFQMYLVVKAGEIAAGLFVFGIMGIAFGAVLVDAAASVNKLKPRHFLVLLGGLLALAVGTLIPDAKQIAAIYLVPRILNSDKAKALPDKLMDLGEEWIKELRPGKREGQ